MRTLDTLLIVALGMTPVSFVSAQDACCMGLMHAETSSRVDRVTSDFATPPDRQRDRAFTRTASLGNDGRYHVRVVSPEGVLRMMGTFADSALTVPDGDFTYYHSNGRIESKGRFVGGVKEGEWPCWTITGEQRVTRRYAGLAWEELQFVVGAAERARTLQPNAPLVAGAF